MSGIAPPSGYSENQLSPGIAIAIRFGAGSQSMPAPKSILLVGNILESDLTRTIGADPGTTYTTAKGTMALNTPTFCASEDAASVYCGAGSALHRMAKAVFAQYPKASVYLLGVAKNISAVRATATLLFAGTIADVGTLDLKIAGEKVTQQVITADSTATTIAAALANAINQQTDSPVYATASTGTVTIHAKMPGPRGNNIPFEAVLSPESGATVAVNGGSAGLGEAALLGGVVSGTGADDLTDALSAVAASTFALIAAEHDDSDNLDLLVTHLNTYAGISDQRRQQGICAFTSGTLAQAVTLAQGQNALRLQLVYHRMTAPLDTAKDPNTMSTGEIAAQVAAARLYGDGLVGGGVGTVRGENAYAAANLDGCMLATIKSHANVNCEFLATEIEALLVAGITPLAPASAHPGYAKIVKSVTTRSLDSHSNPDFKVHDTSKVTVSDYVADFLVKLIGDEYPNKNIAPEPTSPRPPPHTDVIYPSMVRGTIEQGLNTLESRGLLVNVEANLPKLVVEQSGVNPTLILAQIPEDVVDHFHAFAGEILQIG